MNKEKGGSQPRLSRDRNPRLSEKMCNVFLSASGSSLASLSKSKRGGKVEDILLYKFRESQTRLEKKRKQREEEIMQEVTGKPAINPKSEKLAQQKLVKELTNTIKESKFSQNSYEFSKQLFSSASEGGQNQRRSMDPYDVPSSERRIAGPRVSVDIKNRRCSEIYLPVVVTDQLRVSDSQGVVNPNILRANVLKDFQETKNPPNFYDMTQKEREKYWLKMKEAKLESQRKLKAEKEIEECTFQPNLEPNKQHSAIINKSFLKELDSRREDSVGYSDIHSRKQSVKSRNSNSVPRLALSREPEAESPDDLKSSRYYFERTNNIRAPPPNPTSPWPHSFTAAEVQKQMYKGVLSKLKNTQISQPELRISIKSEADITPELITTSFYRQLSPAGVSYRYKPGSKLQTSVSKPIHKPTISTIKSISPKPSTSSAKTVISKSSSKKQVKIN